MIKTTSILCAIIFFGNTLWALDMSGTMEYGLWNQKQRMYYKDKEIKMHEMNPYAGMKIDEKQMAANPMFKQMQEQMKKTMKLAEERYKNGYDHCVTPQNINEFQTKQLPNCDKAVLSARSTNKYIFSITCKDGVSCSGEMTINGKKKFTATTKCSGMDTAPQTSKFALAKFDRIESSGVWVQKNCPPETLKDDKKLKKE